jgi:phosphohistidine phosphatase
MTRLYLLRHGTAEPYAADDASRALVEKGIGQTRLVVRLLSGMGVRLALALASPYLRARQTAEVLLAGLGGDVALRLDRRLEPSAALSAACTAISEAVVVLPDDAQLLAVGHEPLLSAVAAAAIGAAPALELRKGGLVELEVTEARGARLRGQLLGLLRPGHLEGLVR